MLTPGKVCLEFSVWQAMYSYFRWQCNLCLPLQQLNSNLINEKEILDNNYLE